MSDDIQKAKIRDKVSKRIVGGVLITAGLVMYTILFIKAIDVQIADSETAKSVANGLLLYGTSLFGLDLAAKIFKK